MRALLYVVLVFAAGCGESLIEAVVRKLQVQVSFPVPPARVNLTALGTSDWAHFGLGGEERAVRKAAGEGLIGALATVGADPTSAPEPQAYANDPIEFHWEDGQPTPEVAVTTAGLFVEGTGNGFELPLNVGPSTRTFRVFLGGWSARARLDILDGMSRAVLYTDDTSLQTGMGSAGQDPLQFVRQVQIVARAVATTSLVVRYTMTSQPPGNVTVSAATASVR